MESAATTSSSTNKTSLFPAYSSIKQDEVKTADRDWLCNSSFTPSTYEEAHLRQIKCEPETESKKSNISAKKSTKCLKKENSVKQSKGLLRVYHVPESDSIRSQLNKKTFIEETGLSLERAYRVDQKRQPENITFDCFDTKNIAKYRKINVPVGLTPKEKFLWPQPLSEKSKDSSFRYFSKKALKLLCKTITNEEVVPSSEPLYSKGILDFIPLSSAPKILADASDSNKTNFDGVSTDWKFKSFVDHEPEKKFINNELNTLLENEMRTKTAAFNKMLSESPHNVQMWLDFVEFQDECYNLQSTSGAKKSCSESVVIEKKIAILDKALTHNPRSVRLSIAKLKVCRSVWKLEKLISLWDDLIFLNPNSPEVWRSYLQFVLTNLTYFNTSRILKLYSKCIRTLSDIKEGVIESHEAPADILFNMISIVSQLCFVLRSCGYSEKAIALYQALIEFNLFCESSIESLSVAEQIICFEPFWDSGAARVGEEDAIGWTETVHQKTIFSAKIVTESDLHHFEDEILCKKQPLWKTWLEFEQLRESRHWLPWKPNPYYDQTNDDVDDTDRIAGFDDVSKFLFRISDEKYNFLLVQYFVTHLGYSVHSFGCNHATNSKMCSEISVENINSISEKLSETIFSKVVENPLYIKAAGWPEDKFDFVNNIFSQVCDKFSYQHKSLLSLMWLRFRVYSATELKNANVKESLDDVKKFAKCILQKNENRNNLILWFEYIKLEWLSNSKRKAKKTFETLLTSSSSAISSGSMPPKELWYFIRSYIDIYMGVQEHCSNDEMISQQEIVWILIHFGCQENYVPFSNQIIKSTLILKAIIGFKNILQQELSSFSDDLVLCSCINPTAYSALDCVKCFVYLQYFTQNLDAAVQTFTETIQFLDARLQGSYKGYVLEQLHVYQAELLNFHTWNSTASIKPLQLYLYDSIEKYPSNPDLLYFLVKLRNASSVVGPTRRFFTKLLKNYNELQPIIWIFALAAELGICYAISENKNTIEQLLPLENDSYCWGIKWKIRALYEKALESELCSHIPVLWRSYIKFEILNGDTVKAKGVFHRAIQNCGWAKDLLLDGIEYFHEDLKELIDFMGEKQIRVHAILEEVELLMEHD